MTARVRVLMSEGSSLSARESLTALGVAGCHVEVVDPNPRCLARFSKFCSRLHASPKFGKDPKGYLDFVTDLLRRERFDVLYPAHEQAYLFARYREELRALTHLALPRFDVFERMQSKVGFAGVLAELGLPAPHTVVVGSEHALRDAATKHPFYVKAAFGTATQGTFAVRDSDELSAAIDGLRNAFGEGVVVQESVAGRLGRTQAVFDAGRLVGFHACMQIEEGVRGGDFVKESVHAPIVRDHVERLGRHLGWHGGLSLDFIADVHGEPRYIDSNPRLAETGNALAAGLNLPMLLVDVSLDRKALRPAAGKPGVRSFMAIQGLLREARTSGSRLGVVKTIADVVRGRGVFAHGTEELTPARDDWWSVVPLLVVGGELLARPSSWKRISSTTVDAYAATREVARFIRAPASG